MAQRKSTQDEDTSHDERLYIVPSEDGLSEQYFFSDEEADAAATPEGIAQALALAGAWSDLDADEMLAALERIRHESTPTPPIDDLDI
jgi:hypothetical protein